MAKKRASKRKPRKVDVSADDLVGYSDALLAYSEALRGAAQMMKDNEIPTVIFDGAKIPSDTFEFFRRYISKAQGEISAAKLP